MVIIIFYFLEDRIVKFKFRELDNLCICFKGFLICVCGKKLIVKFILRKGIVLSNEEIEENLRSRSVKVRVIEKL